MTEPIDCAGAPLRSRWVRIFVSSTFEDMHAEREELVKRVFPAIRELCESRGVAWAEVDLRWGVSDEQAADGRVLEICLAEIDECRPYFIGLLGHRYGWIPEVIDPELVNRYPWLQDHANASVTEIEIMHAALANPSAAAEALFYFRYDGDEDLSTPPQLTALKSSIRAAGLSVHDGYADAAVLGDLVLRDLAALIERRFPLGSEPTPLMLETARQAEFARSRADVYIGRSDEFRRLDEYVASGGPPLVVTGCSGIGKSALLANWALPRDDVVMHFTAASPESADWSAMLRRLLAELIARHELAFDVPDDPAALRHAFARGLRDASAKQQRTVIVIDALDQLDDRDGALDLVWLPPQLPDGLRLVASALPSRPLEVMGERGWQTLEIPPLAREERGRLVRDYLRQYAKTLAPHDLDSVVTASQTKNPMFLRLLLEELRVHGEHRTLSAWLQQLLLEPDTPRLLEVIFQRWERDYERARPTLVGDALRHLGAARAGLSEAELLDLLGTNGEPLPQAIWAPLRRAARGVLTDRGGRLAFAHQQAYTAAIERYSPGSDARRVAHARLAAYFAAAPTASPRRIEELPWQLRRGEDWDGLHSTLTDADFAESLYDARPFEFRGYWVDLQEHSPSRLGEAYAEIAGHPAEHSLDRIWFVARMFSRSGFPQKTLNIYQHVEELARSRNNDDLLQQALGDHGYALQLRGDYDQALSLMREQERICRAVKNHDGLITALVNQVWILVTQGHVDEALALVHEQRAISEQRGDRIGIEHAVANEAMIQLHRGQFDDAARKLDIAERMARERGDLDALQQTLGSRVQILESRGDIDGALALLERQEEICRRIGDQRSLTNVLSNRARTLCLRGDYQDALTLHVEEERICRAIGDDDGLQSSLGDQGVLVMGLLRDHDRAMDMFERQEQLCRKLGRRDDLAGALGRKALVHHLRGEPDQALALHRAEADIYRELDQPEGLARALGNQARVLREQGEIGSAMALHGEEERLCEQRGKPASRARAYGNQAETRLLLGHLDSAEDLYRRQEVIARDLGNPDALRRALGGQARLARTHGDTERALALSRQASEILHGIGLLDEEMAELGFQAEILRELQDHESIVGLAVAVEELGRRMGDAHTLARTLLNCAAMLTIADRPQGAQRLIDELGQLLRQHTFPDLVKPFARLRRSNRWVRRIKRLQTKA